MLTATQARQIAAAYADRRTPEGQTFLALSEGRRVPQTTASAAVDLEMYRNPGVQELEDLADWIWS
jgi:hypothetical protein